MPDWLLDLLKNQASVVVVFVVFLYGLWKVLVWFKNNVATPVTKATVDLLTTLRTEAPKQTETLQRIETSMEKIEQQLVTQEAKFDQHIAAVKVIGEQTKQQTENLVGHRTKLIDKLEEHSDALGQQTVLLRGIKENSGTNLAKLSEIAESMDGVKEIAKSQVEHRAFAENAVKDIKDVLEQNKSKLTDHDLAIKKALDELDERKRRGKQ